MHLCRGLSGLPKNSEPRQALLCGSALTSSDACIVTFGGLRRLSQGFSSDDAEVADSLVPLLEGTAEEGSCPAGIPEVRS